MKIFIRSLLLSSMLSSYLIAQEGTRTCRILFLNGPQRAASKYYLFDGQTSQEVKLPRLSLSPKYKFPANVNTLKLVTSPPDTPESVPTNAPNVRIPENLKNFYLLISRDPSNSSLPLRMTLVDASYSRIKDGQMLWLNLTNKYIKGKLGRTNLNLPPKKTVLVGKPALKNSSYPVELYFKVKNDNRTRPLIENSWRHNNDSRSIVFIFNEGNRKVPRVQSFIDYRIKKKTN